MAYAPKRSAAAANAAVDAMAALLNGGSIKIYSVGSGIPATLATDISDQILLAQLTFANPAFGAANAGVATAASITSDSDADQTGTASFFRACKSDGTAVLQGVCGTSGSDLNLTTLSIVQHAAVSASAFTITEPLA